MMSRFNVCLPALIATSLTAARPGSCGTLATGTMPGRLASPDGSHMLDVRAGTASSGGPAWEIGIFDDSGSRLLEGHAAMAGDTARIAWDEGGRAWLFDEGGAGIWFCELYEGDWYLTDWRDRYVWYDLPDLLPPGNLFREGAARRMVEMERRDGYSIFICLPRVALDIPGLGDSLASYAGARADEFRAYATGPAEERATADGELTYRMLYRLEPSPDGLVCILGSDFEYAGGVHGMYWFRAFIYDVDAGGFVVPLELVGDHASREAFCSAVVDSLRAMLGEGAQDLEDGAACDPDNYRTLLPLPDSSGGIGGFRVIFDVYQVACYAEGEQEVVVRPWPPAFSRAGPVR
jgi:hypothetical protein